MNQINKKLKFAFSRILALMPQCERPEASGLHNSCVSLEEKLDHALLLIDNLHKSAAAAQIDNIVLTHSKYKDERCLSICRGQVYSQNNEDGIIDEIFQRIGVNSRKFIEIAAGDGIENTTRLLLETGWGGIWIEGGEAEAECISHIARKPIEEGNLVLIKKMVTLENIDDLLVDQINFVPDYISVDIDYNTSHIWKKLIKFKPRVFCIEYNAHYPPSMNYEVPYKNNGTWEGTTFFGASLKALENIGRENGYSLVCCDIFGINAFFIRDDLCSTELFLAPFTAENHYEPPRFNNVHMRGHKRHIQFE